MLPANLLRSEIPGERDKISRNRANKVQMKSTTTPTQTAFSETKNLL